MYDLSLELMKLGSVLWHARDWEMYTAYSVLECEIPPATIVSNLYNTQHPEMDAPRTNSSLSMA